jgi:hypothetical protein
MWGNWWQVEKFWGDWGRFGMFGIGCGTQSFVSNFFEVLREGGCGSENEYFSLITAPGMCVLLFVIAFCEPNS